MYLNRKCVDIDSHERIGKTLLYMRVLNFKTSSAALPKPIFFYSKWIDKTITLNQLIPYLLRNTCITSSTRFLEATISFSIYNRLEVCNIFVFIFPGSMCAGAKYRGRATKIVWHANFVGKTQSFRCFRYFTFFASTWELLDYSTLHTYVAIDTHIGTKHTRKIFGCDFPEP